VQGAESAKISAKEAKPPGFLTTLTDAPTVVAPSDLELARAASAGDRPAMDEVMRRIQCVPRFASAQNDQLGRPLDAAALDDVVQEVSILVWRKLAAFEGRSTLESWIYRVSQFEVLAAIRKRRRAPLAEPVAMALAVAVTDRSNDVFAIERALRLLEELPPESHRILRMKHFDDLTFDEIGARLGLSPNTAKTLYYRALLRLRSQFRADESTEAVSA
jgi:RNA polymerase sigma-70 factor, ECF subfamily